MLLGLIAFFVAPVVLIALTELCISNNGEAVAHASTSVHQYTCTGYLEGLSCVVSPCLLPNA